MFEDIERPQIFHFSNVFKNRPTINDVYLDAKEEIYESEFDCTHLQAFMKNHTV